MENYLNLCANWNTEIHFQIFFKLFTFFVLVPDKLLLENGKILFGRTIEKIQLAIFLLMLSFPPGQWLKIKMIWQPAQNFTAIKLQPN